MNQSYSIKKSIILLIVGCLSFTSCQQNTPENSSITFQKYAHNEKVHLFGNENYPAFDLDVQIILPEEDASLTGLVQAMKKTFFDSLYYPEKTTEENLEILSQIVLQDYRILEQDLALDSMDIGSSYNWQMIQKNKTLMKNSNFISFVNETYSYTGGAHGNTIRNHFVYDLLEDKLLEAKDIFDLSKCESIIQLQKASIQKAGIHIDEIFKDGFRCNENFHLMDKGIIFHYDQYEIASYAAGPIDIFLSFEEMMPYLLDKELESKAVQPID